MDFEDTLQERLLHTYDLSSTGMQVICKLLLNALRSKDFRSFKNTIEHNLKKQPSVLNINYVFPNHSEETCLDIASKNGLTEFVQFLLSKGAKPNRVNEVHNRAPIHFATEGGHADTLAALLAEPTINPNLEAGQQTALHIAVQRKDLAGRTCADLLLQKGASTNIPNSKGLTALHLAAMKGQRDMVRLILEECRQCPDLDCYRDYNDQTTRELIQQKMPDISLPPKCEDREVNAHDLKYYLIANDEMNFLKGLEIVKLEVLRDVAEDLLEMAAQRDFYEAVTGILQRLQKGVLMTQKAARVAVQHGHHGILRELLNVEPEIANDLIFDACLELGLPDKRGIGIMSDRLECLKLILEQENVDVRRADNKGNTPLHYAARAGCREAVTLLLDRGSYIGCMNKFNIPPIADIPANTLSRYFDNCLQTRKERTNDYTIQFNYRCLMPHNIDSEYGIKGSRTAGEMEVLQYMACNNSLKHLLKHPLLSSFLYLKWRRIRYLLYANSAFYVLFYILVNAYILTTTQYNLSDKSEILLTDRSNLSSRSTRQIAWYYESPLWVLTVVALLFFTCREILQFASCPWRYVTNFENLLETVLIVLTIAVLGGAGSNIGAIVILLSAWELVILISQHPRMSTGIEMFRTVSFNFMRFLVPYAFLILAFALAFYTLFKDGGEDGNFPDPGHSLFKTIIMLTGEFDANDIPFVSHPIWSHFVFVTFVFLIAIVLFNLLNGLAVSDTADILCKAELVGLISRIRLVAYIEDIAVGEVFTRWCYCNTSHLPRWNPFNLLTKRILLFPNYLRDGKIIIRPCESLGIYDCEKYTRSQFVNYDEHSAIVNMDPGIIKKAKRIISEKERLSDNEKIMLALSKLQEKLTAMEITLDSIKFALENNNVNNTLESMRQSK